MMLRNLRAFFTKLFTPPARLLLRLGISPDVVTLIGTLGVMFGALYFFPRGELFIGVMVITAFVFADLLDGTMARMAGRSSKWGSFLDSTLDRLADAAVFAGLVLYFTGQEDRLLDA
ncbi:MAG: CDP-alcohol phosphatidyltransferase family protein, partial [Rhodococcus sp.]|nr:CDP-alcohol phosphatidyltransferase family protein [Rhodococcus sp. (in: high G+C Gram-positive bacteria)]